MSSITKHFNRTLFLSVLLIAVSQFNYGFDNQSFAQTQAMDAFDKQFGTYDASTGTYSLSTSFASLLNGIPFIGFAVGTAIELQLFFIRDNLLTVLYPSRLAHRKSGQCQLWPPDDHVLHERVCSGICYHRHHCQNERANSCWSYSELYVWSTVVSHAPNRKLTMMRYKTSTLAASCL